jgi:hypothetical protein
MPRTVRFVASSDDDFGWACAVIGLAVLAFLCLPFVAIGWMILCDTWAERRKHGRRPGRCPRCKYDLTGNVSGVCPECGTQVAPDERF